MPVYMVTESEDYERIFAEQLRRCGVSFFDVYLLHNLGRDRYPTTERLGGFAFLHRLKEQGLAMVPVGHSLLECTEMADHFRAFRYVTTHLDAAFDEKLLCETNRLVTENTLAYRAPGAVAGAYTTEDMAAGDTVFGDHETLVARVPALMSSTAEAMERGVHPMIVAARFHGFFEYLHPFRDGNGRTGRLLSNWILLHAGHPLLIIDIKDRADYINALRQIRSEGTDEYLVSFFFRAATERMKGDLAQKRKNTGLGLFVF
jgi:Fic family protein